MRFLLPWRKPQPRPKAPPSLPDLYHQIVKNAYARAYNETGEQWYRMDADNKMRCLLNTMTMQDGTYLRPVLKQLYEGWLVQDQSGKPH